MDPTVTPETVTFDDVLYVSDGLVPIVEYRGKRFGVPFRLLEPGTSIRAPGDRGRLVLSRAVVDWMELLPLPTLTRRD